MEKTKFTYKFDVEYFAHSAKNSKEEHGGDYHNDDFSIDVDVRTNIIGELIKDATIHCIHMQMESEIKIFEVEKDESLSPEEKEKKIESEKSFQRYMKAKEESYRKIEESIELIDVEDKECVLCASTDGVKLYERKQHGKSLYCKNCWENNVDDWFKTE
jgi:hypothetical protein